MTLKRQHLSEGSSSGPKEWSGLMACCIQKEVRMAGVASEPRH